MVVTSLPRPDVSIGNSDLDQLRELVARHVRLRGKFELASGRFSDVYYDSKLLTLRPEGARLVGEAFISAIAEIAPDADAVGGLTLGADPIISSVLLLSEGTDQPLHGLIVRKEQKEHGTSRWVEGPLDQVDNVVVVDDVVTSGNSAKQAVERLRDSEVNVVAAIALIDRLDGFQQTMNELGVPSKSILTVHDID